MATSEIQNTATTHEAPAQETAHIYSMSREGRRQAIILLLGVVSIWVFALWSLITILEGGITGIEWVSSLLMLAILLVSPMVGWVLLEEANSRVSLPAEGIRYQTIGGIDLTYGWDDLEGFKQTSSRGRIARFFLGEPDVEDNTSHAGKKAIPSTRVASTRVDGNTDDEDEEGSEDGPDTLLLQVKEGRARKIANPVLQFLHSQAHGYAVPIYGGLENRDTLLDEIRSQLEKS